MVANGNPHKDSLCRIAHLNDGSMVSCSQVRRCEGVWNVRECEGVRECGM